MFDLQSAVQSAIEIKHVHYSLSYQWAIYKEYGRHDHESPSGYGA